METSQTVRVIAAIRDSKHLAALLKACEPTADFNKIYATQGRKRSRSSVYNLLNRYVRAGILERVEGEPATWRLAPIGKRLVDYLGD